MAFTSCKKIKPGFTVSDSSPWVGQSISVKNGVDSKTDKNTLYTYDFGDGTVLAPGTPGGFNGISAFGVKNPSHTYTQVGTFTIAQEITKTGNIKKHAGKTYEATVNVTVQMVVPTLTLSDAAPNTGETIVIQNTTDESANKGSQPTYAITITGSNGITTPALIDGKSTTWTPASSGSYVITLYAYQGPVSMAKVTQNVTVGGSGNTTLKNMLNGTWNVAVTGSFTGTGYTGAAGCIANNVNNTYSSISLKDNGAGGIASYSGVLANSGATTTGAGNIQASGVVFTPQDGGLVSVGGNDLFNTTNGGTYGGDSPNGTYKVTSSSATSVVLTKTVNGIYNFCLAGGTYTNVFTITLTR